jgi:xanthine dehydrogenase accessory factor
MSWNWTRRVAELDGRNEPFLLLTVSQVIGSVPREVGAKMVVFPDGTFEGTIGGGGLEKSALADAKEIFATGESTTRRYALTPDQGHACGGTVEVLFEQMGRQPRVFLFGAGHVGQALCRVLEGTPFRVHAVDERSDWIDAEALPATVVRHPVAWREFLAHASWENASTYVVIMTWAQTLDEEILQAVVDKPVRFVGLIGSRRKWTEFRARLLAAGVSAEKVDAVRCPVGLINAGRSPQEIAISVAAQLLEVFYQK